mmetsp:Transcript_655/g.2262  ORF Transcript_655/g.2262 Transcript_655/m.2262 type:complete len:121 (-) Transcript_655:805-1167(-)|eukprot:scaffold86886_cov27-Tisochrysis_lutea.AAC.2
MPCTLKPVSFCNPTAPTTQARALVLWEPTFTLIAHVLVHSIDTPLRHLNLFTRADVAPQCEFPGRWQHVGVNSREIFATARPLLAATLAPQALGDSRARRAAAASRDLVATREQQGCPLQ